jgi:hypothetical protein
MVDTFSEADTRKQTWERDIKGFAKKRYVMKELVTQASSDAWNNSFYQKTATSLTGGTDAAIADVPRGANFPFVERGVTLKNAIIRQHGGEGVIYWQDILTSNLNIETETISDVTDAVVYSVDSTIYNVLSENNTPSTINTVAITAGYEWDAVVVDNRDPLQDLLNCIAAISTDRYPILTSGRGFVAMNEATYALLLGNKKIISHPTFSISSGIVTNGQIARILGLSIYVTPVVTNDKVLVGVAKTCGTWKQTQPLTVDVIIDPQKKYTIRASEIGVCQLTDPESLCLLTNTRA